MYFVNFAALVAVLFIDCSEAGIVLDLFLNFEKKWALCSY